MSKKGGKPVNSGGFGCIFKPPLKCSNSSPPGNYVSKLMTKEDAIEEFENIKQFEQILNKIPNYGNYFLVKNISLCTPAKLSKKDLKDFDKICMNLDSKTYNKDNINDKLSSLGLINIPDAGVDLNTSLHNMISLLKGLSISTTCLLNYYKMQFSHEQTRIYHNDIKPTNIMIDSETDSIKIIDYGISSIYEKGTIRDH